MAGRKRIGSVLKIRAPKPQHEYLRRVAVAQNLGNMSAAGLFVLREAERAGIGAPDVDVSLTQSTPRDCAA